MKSALLSSVVSALALLQGVHAWGADGHAIVATIAELHLDTNVLPTLCSIIDEPGTTCTLASVASWADTIKSKRPWTSPMHYVNALVDNPPKVCAFPSKQGWEGTPNVNVLGAVRNNTNLLGGWVQDGSKPGDALASDALKFLIHFVGDMHQPLHTVARLQGANKIDVKWGKKTTNFHALWDGDLVKRAMDTTPSKWSQPLSPEVEGHLHGDHYDPLIRKVLVDGLGNTWAGEVGKWIQCPGINSLFSRGSGPDEQLVLASQWKASDTDDNSVCPWFWAAPIHNLTCDWIWPKEVDESKPIAQLDADWYGGRITKDWVVEKFLAMAGIRLAAILNLVFANTADNVV